MTSIKPLVLAAIFLITSLEICLAQPDKPDTINSRRLRTVVIGSTVAYTGTMIGLSEIWYSNFDSQPFSFFNDSKEWNQMDKIGHFYSAFQISKVSAGTLKWSGVSKRKADNIAALSSFLMISSIEIFDGRSSGYGASGSDLAANALGSIFYIGQQLIWGETRVHPKLSFHTTYLSRQRPEVLGENLLEKIVKDYNGQTQWLSLDMDKFTAFPKWLNVAVGYGAHDMIYATREANIASGYSPYRQYYLGLDLDLTAINTDSKALKTLLQVLNVIKLPFPAIEFSKKGVKTHPLYF